MDVSIPIQNSKLILFCDKTRKEETDNTFLIF